MSVSNYRDLVRIDSNRSNFSEAGKDIEYSLQNLADAVNPPVPEEHAGSDIMLLASGGLVGGSSADNPVDPVHYNYWIPASEIGGGGGQNAGTLLISTGGSSYVDSSAGESAKALRINTNTNYGGDSTTLGPCAVDLSMGYESSVGSNANTARGVYSGLFAGKNNNVGDNSSVNLGKAGVVIGGQLNAIRKLSGISVGNYDTARPLSNTAIVGGSSNTIQCSVSYLAETSLGNNAGIFVGYNNRIGSSSPVDSSTRALENCIILGGERNSIEGGNNNGAILSQSTVIGSPYSFANRSIALGGSNNEIYGSDNIVIGCNSTQVYGSGITYISHNGESSQLLGGRNTVILGGSSVSGSSVIDGAVIGGHSNDIWGSSNTIIGSNSTNIGSNDALVSAVACKKSKTPSTYEGCHNMLLAAGSGITADQSNAVVTGMAQDFPATRWPASYTGMKGFSAPQDSSTIYNLLGLSQVARAIIHIDVIDLTNGVFGEWVGTWDGPTTTMHHFWVLDSTNNTLGDLDSLFTFGVSSNNLYMSRASAVAVQLGIRFTIFNDSQITSDGGGTSTTYNSSGSST